VNEEALAHWEAVAPNKNNNKKLNVLYTPPIFDLTQKDATYFCLHTVDQPHHQQA
jgi:hypothetical protein